MTVIVKYGTIVGWNKYKFPDGSESDKQLIILGSKQSQNIIAVLTTSKPRGRKPTPGCNAREGYFFIAAGGAERFSKDTWVVINDPQEIIRAEFEAKLNEVMSKRDIWPERDLSSQCVNAIRNCLKQLIDISAHHLSLLE